MCEADNLIGDVGYDVGESDPDVDPSGYDHSFGRWVLLTTRPKFVGYWAGKHADPDDEYLTLRDPRDFVDNEWDDVERRKVSNYLDAGHPYVLFCGWSTCRFNCGTEGEEMGCLDLTDGDWIYPEGYSHYLRKHKVKPPGDFLRHIRNNGYVPRLLKPKRDEPLGDVDKQKHLLATLELTLETGHPMPPAWYKASQMDREFAQERKHSTSWGSSGD